MVAIAVYGTGMLLMRLTPVIARALGLAIAGVGLYFVGKEAANQARTMARSQQNKKDDSSDDDDDPDVDLDDYKNRGDGEGPSGGDHDKSRPRFYRSGDRKRKGEFVQEDRDNRSGAGPHGGGGHQYKLFDKNGKRIGTVNKDGVLIRG